MEFENTCQNVTVFTVQFTDENENKKKKKEQINTKFFAYLKFHLF